MIVFFFGKLLYQLSCQLIKYLLDIITSLGTDSNDLELILPRPIQMILFNILFKLIITFITQNQDLFRLTENSCIFRPTVLHINERFVIIHIVNNDYCMRAVVIRLCNVLEPLLSSCVPDLKLYVLRIQVK